MGRKEARAAKARHKKGKDVDAPIAHTEVEKPTPTGPNGQCCRTCPFWAVWKTQDRAKLEDAPCRRNPPQIITEVVSVQPAGGMGVPHAQLTGRIVSQFPRMSWFGWCGEHPQAKALRTGYEAAEK